MLLSFFRSEGIGKHPLGNEDNEFLFYTKDIPLEYFYKVNSEFWMLNGCFNFSEDGTISKRNNYEMEKFLCKEFSFIIVDFDEVKNAFNRDYIIEILQKNNFNFSLWESRSYNGVDNFNMKGVIEFIGNNNFISRTKALDYVKHLINDYCKVDYSSIRISSVQAPTFKENEIITFKGGNVLDFYYEESKIEVSNFDNSLLSLCLRTYENLGYNIKSEKEDLINLQHPKEKTKGGYFIYKNSPQFCHHFNKSKSFSIFDLIKNTKEFKEYNQKRILNEFQDKIFSPIQNKKVFNQRYIDIETLENTFGKIELEEDKVIFVKSAMGTGKTNFIKHLEKDKKCLIITNRVTLAKEYKEKFPHFKLYNQDKYFEGDSLICQFESLYKYDLKQFDFFIVDEFLSLVEHSQSNLGDYGSYNNLKFFYILQKFKKPLLIMDAFLTGIEVEFINRKNIEYYENFYRDKTNLYVYKELDEFIYTIESTLKNKNGKVTLSTTNKSYAKIIKKIFEKDFNVVCITSETDKDYSEFFKKDKHSEWDLLIYTPTITVGINILNHSYHHFHFSDGTGSVINSLQQVKRNRQAKNIHFYLKNKRFNRIIDYEELESDIIKKLDKYLVKNSLFVEFDSYANLKLSKFGKWTLKKIYMENLFNTNPLLTFEILLKEQFENKTIEIDTISKKYDLKQIRETLKQEEEKEFKEKIEVLKDLSTFEFDLKLETDYNEFYKSINKIFIELNKEEIIELLNISKRDKKILMKFNYLKMFLNDNIKNLIAYSLANNLNKSYIHNLELISQFKSIQLKDKYSEKELKNERFKKFLRLIGYKRYGKSYKLNSSIMKFFNKLKKD